MKKGNGKSMITKTELIKAYTNEYENYILKGQATKASTLLNFIKLLKNCNVQEYETTTNKQGHHNIGLVAEKIVLKFLGLNAEDSKHEVKSYIINDCNVLTNESVEEVYIIIFSRLLRGVYKINAEYLLNKRVGIKELRRLPMQKILSWTKLNEIVKTF